MRIFYLMLCAAGWRACTVDGVGKLIVHPSGVVMGAVLEGIGGTVADLLPSSLEPGESCQVEYRGSHWEATNDSPLRLDAGATVRVLRVQGVGLMVGPDT